MLSTHLPDWLRLRVGEREERRLTKYLPRDLDLVELGVGRAGVASKAVRRLASGRRYVGLEMQGHLLLESVRTIRRAAPPGVTVELVHGAICSTAPYVRSEERRVGKECRSRWSRDH